MSIFDRYVLRMFIKVLLVSFLSFTGLFIIIDLFGNLEEFISYAERQGSLLGVIADYYSARVLSFFDRTSSLLALLAAIFTITWFHRSNELTAVMAAGISKARAVRVLILATVGVALLAAANREFGLPQVKSKLSRNAQDWLGENAKRMTTEHDYRTNIRLGGKETIAAEKKIVQPVFSLPDSLGFGPQLVGAAAIYQPPAPGRPGGYFFPQVTEPDNLKELASAPPDDPVILTARDHDWLKPGQCFVVSDVSFDHIASDRAWRQYSSTVELVSALRNPSLDYGADTRVTVHRRIVQPVLDVTLLFLGLPLVLSRSHRNLFVAAAQCLLLVGVFFVVSLACQALGNSVMISPALAAWLPVMIFVPVAYVAYLRHWE